MQRINFGISGSTRSVRRGKRGGGRGRASVPVKAVSTPDDRVLHVAVGGGIQDAVTRALALSPTSTSPVVIVVAPGQYQENVHAASNVHIRGIAKGAVVVQSIDWHASKGINADQSGQCETLCLSNLTVSGRVSVKAAHGGTEAVFDATLCDCASYALSLARRTDKATVRQCCFNYLSIDGDGIYTVLQCGTLDRQSTPVELNTFRLNRGSINLYGCTLPGDSCFEAKGGAPRFEVDISNCALSDTLNTVTVNAGVSISSSNSIYKGELYVAKGARMVSFHDVFDNLSGEGGVQRTHCTVETGNTVCGTNTLALSPPYLDNDYAVTFTQTGGCTGAPPVLLDKFASSITFIDSVGDREFDVLVVCT